MKAERKVILKKWCLGPESNRHDQRSRDFKSLVSTYFTTEAFLNFDSEWYLSKHFGGATWSRTGLRGFAIQCITALLSRRITCKSMLNLERETRLELATPTLARSCSTY